MSIYQYSAVTKDNQITSGEIEAKNQKAAEQIIFNRFAYPITLHKRVPKILDVLYKDAGTTKMKGENVAGFMLLLGKMLDAGIPIVEALTSLAKSGDKATASLAKALHLRIIEGDDLAQAFSYSKKLIGKDYGNFIKVGVDGGSAGKVLQNLSENITREQVSKKKVISAIRYPALMAMLTLVVSIVLFTGIVPKIVDSVLSMMDGTELPKMTQLAIRISDFLLNNGIFLSIFFTAVIGSLVYLCKKPLNYQWHSFQMNIPILGSIIANKNTATFFRSLAIGISAGMPIVEAMDTAAYGISNKCVKKAMLKATSEVKDNGMTLSEALKACPYISGMEIPIIETGIRSSQIDEMSDFVANLKEIDNDMKIKTFTSLINPIMLGIIGAIVGCIMYAVYGPIFAVMETMNS